MRSMLKKVLPFILPLLLLSCISSGSLADNAFKSQSESSEEETEYNMEETEESPDIYMSSDISGVSVFLIDNNEDFTYLGITPLWYTPEDEYGTYHFLFRKNRFEDVIKSIDLPTFFNPEINVIMQPLTGTLNIKMTIQPDHFWINNQLGYRFTEGTQSVIIGENLLEFRALGYKAQTFTINVIENEKYQINIEPEESDFSVRYTDITPILDPSPLKPLKFSFFSSHEATWTMTLKDENNRDIHELGSGRISDFKTTADWNGKNDWGEMIPDGSYVIETVIKSQTGEIRKLKQNVEIHDRINRPLYHSLHGSPGSLYADTARLNPPGITWTGGVFAHMSDYSLSTWTAGLGWVPNGRTETGINIFGLILDRTPYDDTSESSELFAGVSAYVKQQFPVSSFFTLTSQIKGTLSPYIVIDQATNMQGLSFSLIPELNLHPFSLSLQPELLISDRYARYDIDAEKPESDLCSWMYLRYAFSWNPEIFMLTLSGALRSKPLGEGFALASLADTGLEIAFGTEEISLRLLAGIQYGNSGFYTSGGMFINFAHGFIGSDYSN